MKTENTLELVSATPVSLNTWEVPTEEKFPSETEVSDEGFSGELSSNGFCPLNEW